MQAADWYAIPSSYNFQLTQHTHTYIHLQTKWNQYSNLITFNRIKSNQTKSECKQLHQRIKTFWRQSEPKTRNACLNVKPNYCCFLVIMTNFNFYSVFRLWAEVFHVSASGAGAVRWQQVSEDLVPVNITCIQDTPECVFHITAYNSQVDKILDVRLVQPGLQSKRSYSFIHAMLAFDSIFQTR